MESLVSLEDGLRYHFVSIKFHEFEIVSIITPTHKMFRMKNKLYHAFWHLKFIFHVKSFHCGPDYGVNLMIVKVDWNNIITCFIILIHWKRHFRVKIVFWKTKFSLFKKRKPANLLSMMFKICFWSSQFALFLFSGSCQWGNIYHYTRLVIFYFF